MHYHDLLSFLQRETTFVTVCFPEQSSHFKIGSTLKGKNLLLVEFLVE